MNSRGIHSLLPLRSKGYSHDSNASDKSLPAEDLAARKSCNVLVELELAAAATTATRHRWTVQCSSK